MNISDYIPYGKENAITRSTLSTVTGHSDRIVREMIEKARNRGDIIISDQDGTGYYQTQDLKEISRYYRQERARALSILKRLKAARKLLKEAGELENE